MVFLLPSCAHKSGTSQDLKFVFERLNLPKFSEFNGRMISEYGQDDKDASKINSLGLSEFFCRLFDVVVVGDTSIYHSLILQILMRDFY